MEIDNKSNGQKGFNDASSPAKLEKVKDGFVEGDGSVDIGDKVVHKSLSLGEFGVVSIHAGNKIEKVNFIILILEDFGKDKRNNLERERELFGIGK